MTTIHSFNMVTIIEFDTSVTNNVGTSLNPVFPTIEINTQGMRVFYLSNDSENDLSNLFR